MTSPAPPSAARGCLTAVASILMLLIGLVLLAPGLLCLIIERNLSGLLAALALGAVMLGLLLVFAAIRLMMPRRHG